MEGHVNTYGGMNKDTAYDTIKQNMYIDALDIRISTDKGESQGAFTNIKGNEYSFTIPTSGTFNGIPWAVTDPAGGTPEIIGYGTIRDTIILFVADNEGQKGWIYKVTYDPATREENMPGTAPILLYYSGALNFKKEWPIEALGRYENASTQRIYWTDYNNFFRTINVAASLSQLEATPVGFIDIYPDVEFNLPLLISVTSGGELQTGNYQIAYRLISFDGKETLISPPSNMVSVYSPSITAGYQNIYGNPDPPVNSFKELTFTVDTSTYSDFKSIEFFSLYYANSSATPVATSIEIQELTGLSSTTTLIYSGTEGSIFDIELFTFTSKNFAFKTFKSVTQKDNYLVGANIKSSTISLAELLIPSETFDCKTRRYRNIPIEGIDPPFPIGSPSNNLKNAFNEEFNLDKHWDTDWHVHKQYRYKSDGVTLGGEGPRISYTFHLEPHTADAETNPAFNNQGVFYQPFEYNHDLNDGYTYTNTGYADNKSPFISGLLRGYKRGESYRFGIIFYTVKGEATYVEYIGDIKFPDISEEDNVANLSTLKTWPLSTHGGTMPGSVDNRVTVAFNMGIKFEVDFSSNPNLVSKIKSFQIVRVPRNTADKRRLCQGTLRTYAYSRVLPVGGSSSDNFEFRVNNSQSVVHQFTNFSTGTPLLETDPSFANHKWDSLRYWVDEQDPYVRNGPLRPPGDASNKNGTHQKMRSQHLAFYSPEISYNYEGTKDLVNSSNSAFLITGTYTANVIGEDFEATNSSLITPVGSPNVIPEGVWNYATKFRRTNPVSFNSVNNIRKLKNATYFDMRDSTNVTLQTKTAIWGTPQNSVSPSPDFPISLSIPMDGNSHVRNYYAYQSGSATDKALNKPPTNASLGDIDKQSTVSRAGTNISALTEAYTKDPLSGNTIPSNISIPNPGLGPTVPANPYLSVLAPTTIPGANTSGLLVGKFNRAPVDYFYFKGNDTHGTVTDYTQNTYYENPIECLNPAGPSLNSLTQSIALGDILLPKSETYNGYAINSLDSNKFITASPIIDVNTATSYSPIVFGGDIFMNMVNIQMAMTEFREELYDPSGTNSNNRYKRGLSKCQLMVMETNVNTALDYGTRPGLDRGVEMTWPGYPSNIGPEFKQEDNNTSRTIEPLTELSMYKYNELYSRINEDVLFFIKPSTLTDLALTNDVRSFLSAVKVNGENIDSWTKFGINDYYDVDDHGPINKILNFKDDVYFIQDKGIGNYSINREAVTTTDDGVPTELGTAKGWGKHRYLSKEVGSMHQWAVAATNNAVYFFDAIHRKIYQLGQSKTGLQTSPLSELKGMHSYLQFLGDDVFTRKEGGGDNPILLKGAHIGIDQINNEVLFTFLSTAGRGESNSIMFDEVANEFASRLSINPKIWINNGDTLLTSNTFSGIPNLTNEVFIHNIGEWGQFYNIREECKLTLVINPKADVNKVLRFLEFNSIVRGDDKVIDRTQTITAFEITTEYQNSGKIPYSAGRIKRRFDKWRIKLPRDTTTNGRFRSTHFLLTLYFDNNILDVRNKELIMNRLISYYNPQIF